MKKGERKKQRKALKKRTERKQIRQQARGTTLASTMGYIRRAREYPIVGCWVFRNWTEVGITPVLVARRQPNGNILFGNYLVDLYCMGVKDADYGADLSQDEFYDEFMPQLFHESAPLEISPAMAHEIVHGSVEYAAQFGFRPHRDFRRAQYVLDPPDAQPRTGEVEFGKDGKPFYIAGPYDNPQAILRQLERTAGEGNYHYLFQIGGPPDGWDE